MSIDLGLLILRVVVGLVLIGHGSQKLFGWFGGPGFKGFTQVMGISWSWSSTMRRSSP